MAKFVPVAVQASSATTSPARAPARPRAGRHEVRDVMHTDGVALEQVAQNEGVSPCWVINSIMTSPAWP